MDLVSIARILALFGVTLLLDKLHGKAKIVVEIIGDLLVVFANVIILWGGISFINTLTNSKGASTGIPFSYIAFAVVVCSVSMGVLVIVKIWKKVMELFIDKE